MPVFSKIPVPIGQVRLVSSLFMALVGGFFVFVVSTDLGWFTFTRQLYLVFGVVAGLLLGVLETSLVVPKLVKNTEAFVWQIVPIVIAVFGLPLLVVTLLFGSSEYLPFMTYTYFPLIAATGATSSWYFIKFEKEKHVHVFTSYFGFEYWTQPTLNRDELFYHFIRDVASKDPYHFWGQIGSSRGYIGYSQIFMDLLEEKPEIDPATRKDLMKILRTMNKYRWATLSALAIFLASTICFMIVVFGTMFRFFHFNFNIVDVIGPTSGVILFGFLIGVFVLITSFNRTISKLLVNIDTSKLTVSM